MSVSFNATEKDVQLIQEIGERAVKNASEAGRLVDHLDVCMDVTAVHVNDSPLDLEKLLAFDDFNFNHDVFGIGRHLNRDTGKLMHHFLPRCAR